MDESNKDILWSKVRAIFTIGKKQESLWFSRIIAEFITDVQHRRSSRLFSYLLHVLLS